MQPFPSLWSPLKHQKLDKQQQQQNRWINKSLKKHHRCIYMVSLVRYIKIRSSRSLQPKKVTAIWNVNCKNIQLKTKIQNQILPANIEKIKCLLFKKVYDSFFRYGITMGKCKTIVVQTDFRIFSHNRAYSGIIQTYSDIFRTLCNPVIFRTVVYPEQWYIQNQKHIQIFGIFTTLVYPEPRYISNSGIFKIWGIFRTMTNIYEEAFCKRS